MENTTYKNGKMKATGIFENNLMQSEWIFYRETGQLWQVGNFKDSIKHGHFIRYDRNDKVEYDENFADGKKVKSKKALAEKLSSPVAVIIFS